ncbi:hypothetical protein POM88_019855 [Heracleum sosnowskyi]|uniref:Uncharacterized protein n=1 Tax=Heracleum sosnowskyi TaxID=360622 RepID=A0AAD8IDW5_9APIA|nr:hypothetical protein POM88_019855 [Heracleum sosnowskyi]
MFIASGLEFVPNNYSAPLANENAPEAFHLIQNFLTNSAIGTALTAPLKLSASQIARFWQTGVYDNGGETGSPSIVFEFNGEEYVVTPDTVRDALDIESFNSYTIAVGDDQLLSMMREIGYSGSLAKVGQLKRPFLRKEWSFFFDCITRAFGKKCTNWDAIPTESLQIGYSLLFGNNLDFARIVLHNLGEKMTENRTVVYFSRFCQLIFSECVSGLDIAEDDVILCFKLHKRVFSDLTNKDVKKGDVGDLLLPERVHQFLVNSQQPTNEAGPSVAPSQRSQKKRKRILKSVRNEEAEAEVPVLAGTSQKKRFKKRANRPHSDADEDNDLETLQQRKVRIGAYLFGAQNVEAPTCFEEEAHVEAPTSKSDDVVEDIAIHADKSVCEAEAHVNLIHEETPVPTKDRVNVETEDAANSDCRISEHEDVIMDFMMDDSFEAHPSVSVCHTEGVAADQATLILEDSVGSHTEILSVNNANSEKGEEIDQILASAGRFEAAEEKILNEATGENFVEADDVQEVAAATNSDDAVLIEAMQQIVEDVVHQEAKVDAVINSDHVENEADIDDKDIEDAAEGSHSHPSIQVSLSDDIADSADAREINRQTAEHFQQMYFSRWADADCIFTAQRAADFVADSVKTISTPDIITSLKATVVQVKSLHNRFDETHTAVTNLRNDVGLRDMTLKNDRSYYSSMFKQQAKDSDAIQKRLGKVEDNQAAMATQLTSISNAIELLTSVLLSDDVKKGESVPSDKCKDTQTLRRRDDGNDGGSKGDEKSLRLNSERRPPRSNSDRRSNPGKGNINSASSSKLKSLINSDKPTTDEEIATQIFLQEHGGEVTVEDIDAEMKLLAEEHKEKLKAGTYKKKAAKAPRRKELGISIKENVNSQQSLQYSRRPLVADKEKGKGKLVEEGQLPKKNFSTSDRAQVEVFEARSTADKAHVDDTTKVVTTADNVQVVQAKQFTHPPGFKRPELPEDMKLEAVNFLQTRTVLGKESYDKSGLGSHREKRINNRPGDSSSLAEPGIGVTQENLDKLESVQMIFHRGLQKAFLLYFIDDGRVYRVGESDIHLKLWEELEYVLYLFKIKNRLTYDAAMVIKDRMMKSKDMLGGGVSSVYIPKYRDAYGKIVEMKRNSARFRNALGIKVLEFNLESDKSFFIRLGNEMHKNSIYSLRAAIYQTGESDPELKELKEVMTAELERAERRLLTDYIRTVPEIQEIK